MSGNGIITAASPWMTFPDAINGKPETLNRTIFFERLEAVF